MNRWLFDRFDITLHGTIRAARDDDIDALMWCGMFDRDLIESTLARQARGEMAALVADVNGMASGQAWVELARRDVDGVAYIWAVRVLPWLQQSGVGSRMMRAAERLLADSGFSAVEVAVVESNVGAMRFYRRLGYRGAANPRLQRETQPPPVVCTYIPKGMKLFRKRLKRAAAMAMHEAQADEMEEELCAA